MSSKIKPQINFTIGNCYYMTKSNNWKKAVVGIQVFPGYTFKTSNNSAMDVLLQDGTAVRITENSILRLPEISINKIQFNLERGSLYGKFKKLTKNQKLHIKSNTIVASIRGTQLGFKMNPNAGVTSGYCLRGVIDFYNDKNQNKKVKLTKHFKSSVSSSITPIKPQKMTANEINSMQNIIDSISLNRMLFVTSKINFAPGSSEMNKNSKDALNKIFDVLKKIDKGIIQIAGHTDNIGNPVLNKNLSLKRAESIKLYLIQKGFSKTRIKVIGLGDTQPLYNNATPTGRSKNRRVEFTVISK